jgi:hypothetical protein
MADEERKMEEPEEAEGEESMKDLEVSEEDAEDVKGGLERGPRRDLARGP